jgi:hypothetical protein
MATNDEWCPYEVNHLEKNGICNLCGLPKKEHITKKRHLELKIHNIGV